MADTAFKTTSHYVWCGIGPCQKRDAAYAPARGYYSEGEYRIGAASDPALYYGIDQIGSVRRVFENTSSAPAYDYDPWGHALQTTAPLADYGFAGMFNHTPSRLGLTWFRAYDPGTGRWVSRDPLGEMTDPAGNLYAYVGNEPLGNSDPLGLETNVTIWSGVGWGTSSFGHVSTNVNGTTYSFGPSGMDVEPTSDYNNRNGFRPGTSYQLNLPPEQENDVQRCLSQPQGDYDKFTNNCGAPIQRCLIQSGIQAGHQILPSQFGSGLLNSGIATSARVIPATRPSNGWSAPWAK